MNEEVLHSEDPAAAGAPEAPTEAPWRGRDILYAVLAGFGFTFVLGFISGFTLALMGREPEYEGFGAFAYWTSLVYVGLALGCWIFIFIRRKVTLQQVGFRAVRAPVLLLMIPLTLACLFGNGIINLILGSFLFDVPNVQDQLSVGEVSMSAGDLVWLLIPVAVAAPLIEELIFRGLLYRWLKDRWSIPVATVVSAIVFAITHFIPPLIPSFIFLGVVLALVRERWGSLVPAVLLHALVNASSTLILFSLLRAS